MGQESEGLNDLFEDSGVEEVSTEEVKDNTEAEAETSEKGESEAAEKPEDKPKDPPKEEEKSEPPSDDKVPKAALLDERAKRQRYERELQELREKQPPEQKPDFWEDPEKRLDTDLKSVEQRIEQRFTQRFLKNSEYHARQRHEDYDDNIVSFQEAMERNPVLYEQMVNADDPAEFAYKTGKTYAMTKDTPDIDSFREKVLKEERAKIEEEVRKEMEEKYGKQHLERVPESLTEETGKTGRGEKADPNTSPIKELFSD